MKYHHLLSETEVLEALTDFIQKQNPTRTMPTVVYFSHDIPARTMGIETNFPFPREPDLNYDFEGEPV
jgi:hypothetical protein